MSSQHRCWVYGHNINTDVIFPGKYTYTLRTAQEMAQHALEDLDPRFTQDAQAGDVIIAGRNWGCGSSREQAVICLKARGIAAIIAESFNGLYFRNCINHGLLPIVCAGLRDVVQSGEHIIMTDSGIIAADRYFPIPPLPHFVRDILATGGLLPMLQARFRPPNPLS